MSDSASNIASNNHGMHILATCPPTSASSLLSATVIQQLTVNPAIPNVNYCSRERSLAEGRPLCHIGDAGVRAAPSAPPPRRQSAGYCAGRNAIPLRLAQRGTGTHHTHHSLTAHAPRPSSAARLSLTLRRPATGPRRGAASGESDRGAARHPSGEAHRSTRRPRAPSERPRAPSERPARVLSPSALRGTEMTTPFPVPIQSRLDEMSSAVMRTNEKPSLPVPATPDTSEVGECVRGGTTLDTI